jgi:hypothetical protein
MQRGVRFKFVERVEPTGSADWDAETSNPSDRARCEKLECAPQPMKGFQS